MFKSVLTILILALFAQESLATNWSMEAEIKNTG
jgi:hypothetical protein